MTNINVALWYIGSEYPKTPTVFINATWRPDWYCKVFTCPLREMLTTDAASLAEEFIIMTADRKWAETYKRPMCVGDSFTVGDDRWVYIARGDVKAFEKAEQVVIDLPPWPDISIAKIQ